MKRRSFYNTKNVYTKWQLRQLSQWRANNAILQQLMARDGIVRENRAKIGALDIAWHV
jgi:hypothetical protein